MSSSAAQERVTVGVVIDLPEPHATVVRRARVRVGDPQATLIEPHVTLLPPTSIARRDLGPVRAHLAAAAAVCEPFSMHLAGTGTFRPLSQVVFVQVANGIAQCELLEAAIRRDHLDTPRDYPFHPHVTLAHDIDEQALDEAYDGMSDFVARFPVDRFRLYLRAGEGWQLENEYPLGRRPSSPELIG